MKRLWFIALGSFLYAEVHILAITHKACHVCQKWHEEVHPNYVNEAKRNHYPVLRAYDLSLDIDFEYIINTVENIDSVPLFIVMDDDQVIARFSGYLGYKRFFSDLEEALKAPRDGLEPPTK